MKPPRLLSTAGSAFGSLVAPFEVKFPETGLVLLRGENLDTKGSSASGKSTFIHAMNWPHGTCPVPMTALQSYYTKDPPRVTNTYDFDGKIVQITRGKKFELTIDGVPFRGGADMKEEEIDRLFGTDAEMRRALTYRGQREPGLFLSKTDKKQKEFLTKLLNLDKWDEESKAAIAKAKELEARYNILNARRVDTLARIKALRELGDGAEAEASLADVTKQIDEHEAAQRRYEKTVKEMETKSQVMFDAGLELFKPKLDEMSDVIQRLEFTTIERPPMTPEWERLKTLHGVVQTRLSRLETEDYQLAKDHLAVVEALRTQMQALSLQVSGAHKLGADRDRVVAEMGALEKNVCPTCSREWDDARTRLEDLKIELEQINGETQELEYVKEELDRVKAEFQELPRTLEPNPMISQMKAALKKCEADMAAEEQKATAGANEEIQRVARELRAARLARENTNNEAYATAAEWRDKVLAGIGNLRAMAVQERDSKIRMELTRQKLAGEVGAVRERKRQIEEAVKQETEMYEELQPLQVEMARWSDYGHLTGREAFRGKVFDEALEAISEETNAMLASIANTRNVTLKFSTDEETADGKIRREIVPVLTINGHEGMRPSGGMLSAIELAVDLAVGKIIAERTGVCPGWLILDESFDGLGPREKETCLEILQLYARDRLVVIVDHMSETQGLFTHRITVQNKDGYSTIA